MNLSTILMFKIAPTARVGKDWMSRVCKSSSGHFANLPGTSLSSSADSSKWFCSCNGDREDLKLTCTAQETMYKCIQRNYQLSWIHDCLTSSDNFSSEEQQTSTLAAFFVGHAAGSWLHCEWQRIFSLVFPL